MIAVEAPALSTGPPIRVEAVSERKPWNDVLSAFPGTEVEQGHEWGEVLRDTGWRPCRFALFRGEAPVGALSVLVRTLGGLPWTVAYAPRPPLADPDDGDAWRAIETVWRRLAATHGLVFVRVSAGRGADPARWPAVLRTSGFRALPMQWTTWNMPRIVLTLDLTPPLDELRRSLRKQIRQGIAAASRRGVEVRPAESAADVLRFHALLVETARGRYPVRSATRLLSLWRQYVEGGRGVVLLAEHEGRALGGLCGVWTGQVAAFQSVAVRRDAPALDMDQGALLYWSFIERAKAAGCARIDWGGTGTQYPPRPSDPGWGVYQFKRGFGGELEYRPPYHDRVFRPLPYRLFRLLEDHALPHAWRWRARLNR